MFFYAPGRMRALLRRCRFSIGNLYRISYVKLKLYARTRREKTLQPFSPDSSVNGNNYYVRHLKRAVRDKKVHNIALIGDYGTGKSSILSKLLDDKKWAWFHRTKTISLLTLDYSVGNTNVLKNSNKETANNQELVSIGEAKEDDQENKTNENDKKSHLIDGEIEKRRGTRQYVQKEILKQLFYGEKAEKLHGSRYLRARHETIAGRSAIAALLAIALSPAIKAAIELSVHQDLSNVIMWQHSFVIYFYGASICLLFSIAVWSFARLLLSLRERVISKMGFADLSLDFSKNKIDLEQAQDELIYFFKTTKYKVVVLEDLDRFNDEFIFEELTRLNFILNSSKSIRQKVTFIYAMRSELMPNIEARTKIFDINIDVIPFLTKDNALEKAHAVFARAGFHEDIQGALKVIARNIHNMRAMKAICNHAVIIRDKVVGDEASSGLSAQQAIAMATISELYPVEYTKMRSGASVLDTVYATCLSRHESAIKRAYSDMNKYKENHVNLVNKAGQDFWNRVQEPQNIQGVNYVYKTTLYRGETITKETISEESFWKALATDPSNTPIEIIYKTAQYYQEKEHRKKLTKEAISEISGDVKTICYLLSHQEDYFINQLKLKRAENVFNESNDEDIERLKRQGLPVIAELVSTRIITQDYRLYLTPFAEIPGSNQLKAFKIKCLEQAKSDYLAELSEDDIVKLLEDADNIALSSPAFYNIHIFQWLVQHKDNRLETILKSAEYNMSDFIAFYELLCAIFRNELNENYGETIDGCILKKGSLNAYIHPEEFMLYLTQEATKNYPVQILNSIVNNHHLGDTIAREVLFDVGVLSMARPEEVIFSEVSEGLSVARFLNYYEDYIVINGGAEKLAKLMVSNKVSTQHIERYKNNSVAFEALVEHGQFELNEKNMLIVGGDKLKELIESKRLVLNEDAICIALTNKKFSAITELALGNVADCIQFIKSDNTKALLVKFIEKNHLSVSFDNIILLSSVLSNEDIVRIFLIQDITWQEASQILGRLNEPYSRIKLGNRPKLIGNDVNNRLIDKVHKFGVINSVDILDGGEKRLNMKKKLEEKPET